MLLILFFQFFFTTVIILSIWLLYKKNRDRIIDLKRRLYSLPINQKKNESLLALYNTLELKAPINHFNGYVASPDFLHEIVRQILLLKPHFILELGSGVSSIIIGNTLKKNGFGKLVSIEHLKSEYQKTNNEIKLHKLEEFCECIYAPLTEKRINDKIYNWYSIDYSTLKTRIDMLIIDGPPTGTSKQESRFPALPCLKKYLKNDYLILVDDSDRLDEIKMLNQWKILFPEIKVEYMNLDRGLALIK
jgi:predicted O-methyltransferase YrrM